MFVCLHELKQKQKCENRKWNCFKGYSCPKSKPAAGRARAPEIHVLDPLPEPALP